MVTAVKNTSYIITLTTKRGRKYTFRKDKQGDYWIQKTPAGKTYKMTAEQLLSHILPPLTADQPSLTVRVERRRKRRQVNAGLPKQSNEKNGVKILRKRRNQK